MSQRSVTMADESKMFVDGAWIAARGGVTHDVIDPATEQTLTRVASGGCEDAEAAAQAARRAFDHGPWPRMHAAERGAILCCAAEKVRERADDLARLETLQMGKVLSESLADMSAVAFSLERATSLAVGRSVDSYHEKPAPVFGGVVREPIGVVVAITPWNFPLMLASWKFAYALAAGNVVIVKPASISPLTTLEMARIFQEMGLPNGVFQVLVGPGRTVGDYLCTSPLVDMVNSHRLARRGPRRDVPCGKHDQEGRSRAGRQEPEHRVRRRRLRGRRSGCALRGVPQCRPSLLCRLPAACGAEHPRSVARRARASCGGDQVGALAWDPASTMGPLASREQLETTEDTCRSGSTKALGSPVAVVVLARRASSFRRRSSTASTTRCASPKRRSSDRSSSSFPSRRRKRRSPSPTTPAMASVVGSGPQDLSRAERVARAIRAGMIWVNTYNRGPGDTPWGGYKLSGLGRERGEYGLDEFTEVKSVVADTSGEPLGFYPGAVEVRLESRRPLGRRAGPQSGDVVWAFVRSSSTSSAALRRDRAHSEGCSSLSDRLKEST